MKFLFLTALLIAAFAPHAHSAPVVYTPTPCTKDLTTSSVPTPTLAVVPQPQNGIGGDAVEILNTSTSRLSATPSPMSSTMYPIVMPSATPDGHVNGDQATPSVVSTPTETPYVGTGGDINGDKATPEEDCDEVAGAAEEPCDDEEAKAAEVSTTVSTTAPTTVPTNVPTLNNAALAPASIVDNSGSTVYGFGAIFASVVVGAISLF